MTFPIKPIITFKNMMIFNRTNPLNTFYFFFRAVSNISPLGEYPLSLKITKSHLNLFKIFLKFKIVCIDSFNKLLNPFSCYF